MIPILSICIPTYNRLEILRKTIESIYKDLREVSLDEFEVIISDNSAKSTAQSLVEEFSYNNLYYYATNCEGFMNSFYALSYGHGLFLKLNNNYTMFRAGTLHQLIEQLKCLKTDKIQVIYTNGLKQSRKVQSFFSFDQYIAGLSYLSSWSAGYGMWKEDFDRIKDKVTIDKYFPQTSLLLTQYYKKKFIIDDRIFFDDQHVPKKGGYDIFKVFSINFVKLIKKAYNDGTISKGTLQKVKSDLLYKYLSSRYFKTVIAHLDNFEHHNIKKTILTFYTYPQYLLMLFFSIISPFMALYRKLINLIYNKFKG
ncbi:MAG: glycosyltransferase [Clostridium tyrobutyricum]|jgi:glycosyltransferase involved in cell wall biosynthesis|nr:glycosyltransferase [Clostridium tyrobutyricum]